ncbi:MAG: DUF4259 domain-containing protein [Pseudomonadota bacterium]
MGAWATGIFDTDSALDWVMELAQVGVMAIAAVLLDTQAAAADGFIDVDPGSGVLATCDITAAGLGHPMVPRPNFDGMLDDARFWAWVDGRPEVTPTVALICLDTIELVVADPETTELYGLWRDGEALFSAMLLASAHDLRGRLEAVTE